MAPNSKSRHRRLHLLAVRTSPRHWDGWRTVIETCPAAPPPRNYQRNQAVAGAAPCTGPACGVRRRSTSAMAVPLPPSALPLLPLLPLPLLVVVVVTVTVTVGRLQRLGWVGSRPNLQGRPHSERCAATEARA